MNVLQNACPPGPQSYIRGDADAIPWFLSKQYQLAIGPLLTRLFELQGRGRSMYFYMCVNLLVGKLVTDWTIPSAIAYAARLPADTAPRAAQFP